jgi:hypothetical protein
MKIHTDTFTDVELWKASILDKLNIRGVTFTDIEYYTSVVDDIDDDGVAWRFMGRCYLGTEGQNSYEAPIVDAFIKSWMNCYHLILKLDGIYDQQTRSFPEAEEKAQGIITEIKALYEEKQNSTTLNHKEVSI